MGMPATVGGFIAIGNTYPTIANCNITGNSAYNSGGGINCFSNAAPVLINCTITGNSANHGGGIYCQTYAAPVLTNCTITGNTAAISGGGIYCYYYVSPELNNCTISGNTADSDGGGIYAGYSTYMILNNSILWGDEDGSGPNEVYYSESGVNITYSDVQGGWPGTGNINQDPQFAEEVDFHLESGSPCVDTGDPSISDGCRPPGLGGVSSDMGAYGGSGNCDWREGAYDLFLYPTGPTTVSVGDTIFFDTLFWNSTDSQATGDYWLSALLPNQMEILLPGFVLNLPNPLHGSTPAHGATTLHNELRALFPGTFQVIARVGVHPNLVFDEESFEVVILP